MADFSNDFAPDFNVVVAEPAALTTDPINPGILQTAGEDVLYRSASGLEKALATVEGQRLIAIYAELIRDQWDPDKISLNNLPYLAWATGVNLWEADWDDTFRRWWVKNQWQLKAQRGSDLGLQRFINAVSSSKAAISLVRYTAPPQRAYALRPDSDASIAFTGSPRVGDNITIDGRIFTFVAANAVRDQANIQMMMGATVKGLADALNNSVTPAIQRFVYAASGSRLLISKRDPTDTDTFTVTTNVPAATVALIGERQAYVARFPQLRLYPYVARTKLPWNCFVGGVQFKPPTVTPGAASLALASAFPLIAIVNTGSPIKTPAAAAVALTSAVPLVTTFRPIAIPAAGAVALTGTVPLATFGKTVIPSAANLALASTPATVTVLATTFNPAAVAAGITLSNGNLTASVDNATGRATCNTNKSHSSGKFYWEFTVVTPVADNYGMGICNAAHVLSVNLGTNDSNSVGFFDADPNLFFVSSSFSAHNISYTAGDTVSVAWDLGASLFWIRKNGGNWNNGPANNPATATGGVSYTINSGPYFAAATLWRLSSGSVTANFGATSYAFTPPAGFGNW